MSLNTDVNSAVVTVMMNADLSPPPQTTLEKIAADVGAIKVKLGIV